MSVIEIEKIVRGLEPQYLPELRAFIEQLLARQEASKPKKQAVEKAIPERLELLLKFKGDAPYPDLEISEEEFYEQ